MKDYKNSSIVPISKKKLVLELEFLVQGNFFLIS